MLHAGPAFKLSREENFLELCFDAQDGKVNVFNRQALKEFGEVLTLIESLEGIDGLCMTSGKSVFVAGADITEFLGYFASPDEVLRTMLDEVNAMFNRFEDLPFPTGVGVVRCACHGSSAWTMRLNGFAREHQKRRQMHLQRALSMRLSTTLSWWLPLRRS